jgi:alpha-amylase
MCWQMSSSISCCPTASRTAIRATTAAEAAVDDPLVHGFLPTDKGYYHGGDLAGLRASWTTCRSMGVTAIWMTPQFTNRWVQGDGTIAGSSAGYHGYWQTDYTTIDPHFGSNTELKDLIDARTCAA